MAHFEEVGLDLDVLDCLIAREKRMREYLLKKEPMVGGIEHHIFFFEDIKELSNDLREKGLRPHTTMQRSITSYTFFNKNLKTHATVTNMLGIMLFTLYSKGKNEYWENTEILNSKGVIKAENQKIESVCGSELIYILENAKRGTVKISDKQRELINNKVKGKEEEFKKSKVYETLSKDFDL